MDGFLPSPDSGVVGASELTASAGTDWSCMEEAWTPSPSGDPSGVVESVAPVEPPCCPEDDPAPFDRVFLYRLPKAETVAPARGKPDPASADPATPRTASGEKPEASPSSETDSLSGEAFSPGVGEPDASLDDDAPEEPDSPAAFVP